MHIKKNQILLSLAFFLAFSAYLIIPAVFPSCNLSFFVPFLIIVFYKRPFAAALVFAFLCGLLMDLVADYQHLGLYTLNYCATTAILFPQKRHFFKDSPTTIPLMTLLFVLISTVIQLFLIYSFEKGIPLSWGWVGTDLILMPLFDSLYAYIFFTLPNFFMPVAKKREYFLRAKSK